MRHSLHLPVAFILIISYNWDSLSVWCFLACGLAKFIAALKLGERVQSGDRRSFITVSIIK